ncbi:MAG: tRNA (adenosine(37)-N6)-threonylcarbamoyltransferase complex transferase subunit TsaD [Candidatus Pacebacteria bacterium]|nr:tRNA (adenosine(37)-N6)-threonylcarbamoyltransferase complex transferase subunit TsaD [Candidatus Paceibacterota bacterium]
MKILSIETSCDDTGISILEAKGAIKNASFKVLANYLSSQTLIHAPYGGVFPALAKREHIKNLPLLLNKALTKTKLDKKIKPVDLIVVTSGPGLEPALWTGIVFAKELATKWKVPLLPVNHMQGHILSVFGKNKGTFKLGKVADPVISLLVSGGHTELVLTKNWTKNKILGQTLDDAAGEAFDKVARMMGLPYPGGPEISRLASSVRKSREGQSFTFPRPMMYTKNFDFSFSGLKTSVLYFIQKLPTLTEEMKKKISLEFENAVVETLVYKTKKAVEKYDAKTLIVGGGVSANKYLKSEIKKALKGITILFPERGLSMDNAVMIGTAGYIEYLKKEGKVGNGKNIKADGNLKLS